ncbi:MAG TPA: glucose-6-phosphate isomerase [Planctomycetes bacterium]|nr:glucose-6-phosphate isomerase [Planctomycetota bacterium]HIJ69731.1 glucose-6-phosphate isomerase [Planctomycetota bacterium]
MAESGIRLYYKNVTAEVIGVENGITDAQFDDLVAEFDGRSSKTGPLITELNRQRAAGRTPYRDLPYNTEYPADVKQLVSELAGRCENFVVLGIGGSALGNIALQTALNPYMYNIDDAQRKGRPRLFVFDNVDPVQFGSFLDWVAGRLDRTIFNVISKSGQTVETAAQFMIIRRLLLDKIGSEGLRNQVIATTDATKGILRSISEDAGFRTLIVPEGVGGRFSVLSPVGLFSAAMCGIDIDSLLAGAKDMDKRVRCEEFSRNPAAVIAAINWHYYNRGKNISVMMPYSYALRDLADWYRQLWAESLGKAKGHDDKQVDIGPTPVKALGATDQHSQVQLYREGPNDKLFTFLQVENFNRDLKTGPAPAPAPELGYLAEKDMGVLLNSEKTATEYALLDSQRPCITVFFPEVNARTVGEFIYLFEVATSFTALLFRINAYDQPAVELGKEATFALMGKPGKKDRDLARQIRSLTEVDKKFLV